MDSFELVLVDYCLGGRDVLIAPYAAVNVGDIVETDFGKAKVLDKVFSHVGNDVFSIFSKAQKIHRVLSVVLELHYDDENA